MTQSEEDLQIRMQECQESLEVKGLHLSTSKTMVMVVSKTGKEQISIEDRHGRKLKQEKSFKYLGSMVDSKGGKELDVRKRIRAGWAKW